MNNLASTSRLRLSTIICRKLIFILLCQCNNFLSAQNTNDTICSDFSLSIFDEVLVDSLSWASIDSLEHADTIYHSEHISQSECTWDDFNGLFDIEHWTFHADNHDGNLHTEDLPNAIALEGAKHSPRNNYNRYVASLKAIAPASGYVAFDWHSYGGNFYEIDAFYFTVNDSCVQLTRTHQQQGHFVSWYIEEGDIISLEQASNGTSDHITTEISNFQFIPEVYKIIERKWSQIQYSMDTAICFQRIEMYRPSLDAFTIPYNHDGYDAPFLSCEDDLAPEPNDYPYYIGIRDTLYLSETPIHGFNASYSDKVINQCGGNQTIRRLWKISDECSGTYLERSQILKIKDDSELKIKCPRDQTFHITKCAVSVFIRQPKAWSACNENVHVDIEWAYGSGSRVYGGVVPGRYEIKFTARDGCGKEKVCRMWLNLIYQDDQSIQCKAPQFFNLPASGQLRLTAKDLVEKTGNSCSDDLQFEIEGKPFIDLDCNDVGKNNYEIRYFDPQNPEIYSTCMVEINLSEATLILECPDDLTISCKEDLTDLSRFGYPNIDGFSNAPIIYEEDRQLNDCGTGYIHRTWRIQTPCGLSKSCSQRIKVNSGSDEIFINWPKDYEITGCQSNIDLSPENLPFEYDFPQNSGASCGTIAFSYQDSSPSGTKYCNQFSRFWKVEDSCNPGWSRSHTQVIAIRDVGNPSISAPADQKIFSSSAICDGSFVSMIPATVTDCDADVVVVHNSPYATMSGADASGIYPVGTTSILFTATDACGNQSIVNIQVEVIASEDPALACIGELEIELEENSDGSIGYTLSASQLITSRSSSCDGQSYMYAFAEDVNASTTTLTCSDIGLKSLDVFRFNGLEWTQCTAWIRVQDSQTACQPVDSYASIKGHISTEKGDPVKYANIVLGEGMDVNTDGDGNYVITDVPTSAAYDIRPVKEINIRNGLTVLDMVELNRHLLGTRFLTSPYQIISCDVNNTQSVSVGDLYKMNGLILGTITDLDHSWKFLPADYVFPDPTDPFAHEFPEMINLDLHTDKDGLDFIGVKIGDPNHSADPTKLQGGSSAKSFFELSSINRKVEKDESFEVSIQAKENVFIEGMQFTLSFDPTKMEYLGVSSSFGLDPNLVINTHDVTSGSLGIVFINYHQEQGIEPLNLQFRSRVSADIRDMIGLTSSIYDAHAVLTNSIHPLKLKFEEDRDNWMISTAPNPFYDNLDVLIESEIDDIGPLRIIDISGKEIFNTAIEISKGPNIHTLKRTDFENAGIYILRLSTTSNSKWIKVILID